MQRRATIWILGAFKTSPLEGIEVIVGLTVMNLKPLGKRTTLVLEKHKRT